MNSIAGESCERMDLRGDDGSEGPGLTDREEVEGGRGLEDLEDGKVLGEGRGLRAEEDVRAESGGELGAS